MKILILGSGAREHALAWKVAQSPRCQHLILAPGNAAINGSVGEGQMPAGLTLEKWPLDVNGDGPAEFEALAERAKKAGVDLAIVGPDRLLALGVRDVFSRHGVPCFGPTQAAARIEFSKSFAKEIMRAAGVPTADFFVCDDLKETRQRLQSLSWKHGWVVKADGLALGKGVRVCDTLSDANQAVEELFPISGRVVIEEKLKGQELSWMAFCQGEHCSLLEPARDYKRLRNQDQGPNTGGMGAFSPVPEFLSESWRSRIQTEVFTPVLGELSNRGAPFDGLLYAGLMVEPKTGMFWVLEFNARWGDPEAQVLLPRMQDDLVDWCSAVVTKRLDEMPRSVGFLKKCAVYVVAAASGYPDQPEKGVPLEDPTRQLLKPISTADPHHFFAGVSDRSGRFETSGGRVYGALGLGDTGAQARALAYERILEVRFNGMHFRTDIAEGLT